VALRLSQFLLTMLPGVFTGIQPSTLYSVMAVHPVSYRVS
jgi:hypothetical protein